MKANSEKTKQSKKATRRVLAGVLCGASVLSLVLSLVMPPISQAIANDAQVDSTEKTVTEDSSTESTDVDNANNGDTKKLNSDDAEGVETGDDVQLEGQSEEEQQNEEEQQYEGATTSDDKTVVAAAEGEQAETAAVEINNETELIEGLQNVAENQSGSFQLMKDLDCNDEIFLDESGSNITLDLNGCKIKHSGEDSDLPLFSVSNGANLTIKDSKQAEDKKPAQSAEQGKLATVERNGQDGLPLRLTYYVTESSVNAENKILTTETTYKHEVEINGAIVVTAANSRMKLINVYAGGTFNLQSGVLTTAQNVKVDHLIYAEEGSIVNMSGGYVCGATSTTHGAGIELGTNHNSGATLNLTGGVIAGNYAPNGGGVNAYGSKINMTGGTGGTTGGTISGNGTFENSPGFGAGICAQNSDVTVSDGYVTNNNCQFDYIKQREDKHKGNGCHGGGGIAAFNGGSLTINGGYITGNYSAEAGGGIYAGAWGQALSSFKFSGGTIASNVAQNSEGGGIRIAAPTVGVFEVPEGSHAYITNNTTNTTYDWGGGGVFVQGYGDNVQAARLEIHNALITKNDAQGFGGGFAACPTGETAITDTDGIAIYGNTDNNGEHRSGGGHDKNDDADKRNDDDGKGEITEGFKNAGHRDLFLIRDQKTSNNYIAAVTGQMLGGGAANWTGMIDGQSTTIGKYEGTQAKYMIGLNANPSEYDQGLAVDNARLFITGNKSNVHGGGIMTNGNVVAGSTMQVSVYPKMKLNGTKALEGRALTLGEFRFQLLEPGESGEVPSFNNNDGKLQLNGCSIVGDGHGVTNDAAGNFAFDLGRVNSVGTNVYYLVEDPGNHVDGVDGVYYDKTIYKIELTTRIETRQVLNINYICYLVKNVRITNLKTNKSKEIIPSDDSDVSIKITVDNTSNTFTNVYKPKGSWTPQVTKKVDGGAMKRFKFELFTKNTDNTEKPFQPKYKYTAAESGNSQIVTFDPVEIGPLGADELDSHRQAQFTYYICECDADENDGTKHEGYKNDTKTFKVVVTATDKGDGTLECTPTYYEIDANNTESKTDNPTFTNTYSTSLPLSGMSGVTLTYLAGAAVLCAAAAWMHIRRKANAKGGKRRE